MAWSLTPSHHGIELLLDDVSEEVAQVEYDPDGQEWVASACPKRFPTAADLPAVFAGRVERRFSRRGNLLKFFGLPLPGEVRTEAPETRRAA